MNTLILDGLFILIGLITPKIVIPMIETYNKKKQGNRLKHNQYRPK